MPKIKYAYLKDQTWLFRRNYPQDVAVVLGSRALKQSLKTSDAKIARLRAAEVNQKYEDLVRKARTGVTSALPQSGTRVDGATLDWGGSSKDALARLRSALAAEDIDLGRVDFASVVRAPAAPVHQLATRYLNRRSNELQYGGFKSVRYSVGLFVSKFGDRPVTSLNREDGREFLSLVARLSPVVGKSERSRGLSLDQLVAFVVHRDDEVPTIIGFDPGGEVVGGEQEAAALPDLLDVLALGLCGVPLTFFPCYFREGGRAHGTIIDSREGTAA